MNSGGLQGAHPFLGSSELLVGELWLRCDESTKNMLPQVYKELNQIFGGGDRGPPVVAEVVVALNSLEIKNKSGPNKEAVSAAAAVAVTEYPPKRRRLSY